MAEGEGSGPSWLQRGPIGGAVRWTREQLGRIALPPPGHGFVAMVATPSGHGAWLLDRKGNVHSLGDAPEFREVPQPEPWRDADVIAMAATPSGRGLWVLDRKGNVVSFGDAPEFREVPQPEPWRGGDVIAMAATPSGQGLWLLDRAGNVFSFGDAPELRRSE